MKTTVALVIGIISTASHAQNSGQVFAQCESDAYGLIGVQTDRNASAEYLEKSWKLCACVCSGKDLNLRVCIQIAFFMI